MKKILTIVVGIMVATGAMAAGKPLQVSITPGLAIYDRTERIEGLCLSIWGENPQTALALGIVNGSSGSSAGLSWALILNYADDYKGIHWAPINYTKGDFLGWQAGFVNYVGGAMKGLQSGTVNYAGRLTGLQFGFLNYAETAENGVQIGLVNIIPQNAWFTDLPNGLAPGMIFVNWRF
ncbi:MAG: hypothetical protein LC725_02235 [Lentisphaerae bacterium]|nr:hypothetical protein [Lentisphaerota bacterium]